MPFTQPSRSDVHVNRPLTNISIGFVQSADNFVAARVFPTIPVSKQSDAYFTYDRGDWNRDEMEERAPGTESAGGSYAISNDTYFAKTRAYHKDIPEQVRANQDSPISLDREATIYVTSKALIKRETSWVASYFVAGDPGDTWTFDIDGAATRSATLDPTAAGSNDVVFWNNAASTPIEDIRLLKRTVQESTGFRPNILTLGRPVFDALIDHPDIVGRMDRGQTVGVAQVNKDALAALFELDEVLVMDSVQNTAAKGQTNVHSFIGGKHALLSYRPPEPGILTPSAGYTFNWTGLVGSGPDGFRVKKFFLDAIESDRIEIDGSWDQKKISADLGAFFGNIVQ